MVDLIFVYGTLRRELGHPMHRVLAQHSRYAGKATFPGRMFELDGYPGVVPDQAGRVLGEVYRFRAPQPLLTLLDRYEGCNNMGKVSRDAGIPGAVPGNPEDLYRREIHTITAEDGEALEAWIYLYNHPVQEQREIPDGDYLKAVRPRQGNIDGKPTGRWDTAGVLLDREGS